LSLEAPWEALTRAWHWMLDPANAGFASIQALTGFHLALIALFGALFLIGAKKLPLTYTLYIAPQLLLVMMSVVATPLASASRYMLVMFPAFVVLALAGRRRWFHTAWLVASLLGLGLLFLAIMQNIPVG
jgi:hypothetical protein